jgi:dTDP-4-dehydrorhamnose reductase
MRSTRRGTERALALKILVTGSNGQVGWELTRSLAVLGDVTACDRSTANLEAPETLAALVSTIRPDVIVNAAAYTAVDQAEKEEALAYRVNAESVGALAQAARDCGALFVHYSTDYVFDGTKSTPYVEGDAPCPANAYGRTKLAGEQAISTAGGDAIVLRTSWVYAARGKNFMKTILRLAAERDSLRIVDDQFGAPTSASVIADLTAHVVRQAQAERKAGTFDSGIFHMTASGATSWHGFARAILDTARAVAPAMNFKAQTIEPIPASAYPLPAPRPANSILDNGAFDRRFGLRRPDWQSSLSLVMRELAAFGALA